MNIQDLLLQIAREIEAQTASFEHFKNFHAQKCVSGSRWIQYSNNVQMIPNPNYDDLIKKERALDKIHPRRLRPLIHKEIPSYPEKDGIYLRIEIISPEIEKEMMRVLTPYTRIRGWAIEVVINGVATNKLRDIRKIIHSIIDKEKEKFEKTDELNHIR